MGSPSVNVTEDAKVKGEALSKKQIQRCNETERETLEIRVDTDGAIEQLEISYKKAEGLENAYLFGVNNKEQIEVTENIVLQVPGEGNDISMLRKQYYLLKLTKFNSEI